MGRLTAAWIFLHRLDPLLRTTVAASSGHARFPTVAQLRAEAQQQSPPSEPTWETPLGTTTVKQLLAGSRGAIAVTDTDSSASLRGVNIYVGHKAFTSPDGA